MLETLSSKAIYTKVKAMYGHMLTMADYEQLMHKTSVPACAAWLKAQPAYAPVLRDVQETQIHRGALELLLGRALFEQYLRLAHYACSATRFLHDFYTAKTEIQMIINRIRLFQSLNPNEFIQAVPGYLVDHLSFDVLSLGSARTFGALLEKLARTPYHRILAPLAPRDGSGVPLPAVEHALFEYYYNFVFGLIARSFRGRTARDLHAIFAAQAQLFNIQVVYRLKRFFEGKPADLERIVLRYRGRLPLRIIDEIVSAPDADAMLAVLARSKYGAYFGRDRFVFIENSTGTIRHDLAKRFLTFSQSPVTAAVAFVILREIEVENLITVIEGVRYGLDVPQIRPLLIQGGA